MMRRSLLCLTMVLVLATVSCSRPQQPNILIVMVDALRRDHLGFYGHSEPTSPFLDEIATRSVVFDQAYSHCSQTIISTASFFTSEFFPPILILDLAPSERDGFKRHQSVKNRGKLNVLVPRRATFPQVLAGQGYATVAFLTNPHHHEDSGFAGLFSQPHVLLDKALYSPGKPYVDAATLHGIYADWLSGFDDRKQPFLAYVHFMDPHNPYAPPPSFASQLVTAKGQDRFVNGIPKEPPGEADLAFMRQSYDAEIAYVDSVLSQLYQQTLERMTRDTILVVTSDHGEEFMDHGGLGHGQTLEKEQIWVPLLLHGTARPAERISRLVRHVDVGPTLLQLAGVSGPEGHDGRSLLANPSGSVSATNPPFSVAQIAGWLSFTTPEWHYAKNSRTGANHLYDLQQDAAGLHNIAVERPDLVTRLEELMKPVGRREAEMRRKNQEMREYYLSEGLLTQPDDKVVEQLRALGYLQ